MTTLSDYLAGDAAMTLTALSAVAGVSKARLSQLRDSTDWPADLALTVERETGGALNASELSPTVARARQSGPGWASVHNEVDTIPAATASSNSSRQIIGQVPA